MQQIEKYQILETVSTGTSSTVYKARHLVSDRIVALKVLSPALCQSQIGRQRFHQEAKAIAAFDHPGLVKIFSYAISADGLPYLVLEFVNGKTLEQLLKAGARYPAQFSLDTFALFCSALSYVHGQGYLHRDLNPANLMIMSEDSRQDNTKLKIIDFGIVKKVQETNATLTRTGEALGSNTNYMSPEQLQGKSLDLRSDIYSLGAILFECLAGQAPIAFTGLGDSLDKEQHLKPARLAELCPDLHAPPSLVRLIHKCLEKDPDNRPASMQEVEKLLSGASGETLVRISELPGLNTKPAAAKKFLKPALTLFLLLLFLVPIFAVWYSVESRYKQKNGTKEILPGETKLQNRAMIKHLIANAKQASEKSRFKDAVEQAQQASKLIDAAAYKKDQENELRYRIHKEIAAYKKQLNDSSLLDDLRICIKSCQGKDQGINEEHAESLHELASEINAGRAGGSLAEAASSCLKAARYSKPW